MVNRGRIAAGTAVLLALVGGMASPAAADPGTVTIQGYLDGTVGSTTFTDASFTAVTTFLWEADTFPSAAPVASYPSNLTFTIGANTYTSIAADDIETIIYKSDAPDSANYGVEIDATSPWDSSGNFAEFFNDATFLAPTQTVLLSDLVASSSGPPFLMLLTNGQTLDVTAFDSFNSTVSIYVPEPASLSLLGLGLGSTLWLRRRRRA